MTTEKSKQEKPTIMLKPLDHVAIHTPTRQDYKTLMRVCECADWNWCRGDQPIGQAPTKFDGWKCYKEETCISDDLHCKALHYTSRSGINNFLLRQGYKILLPEDFYEFQKLSLRQILQINRWFDQLNNR